MGAQASTRWLRFQGCAGPSPCSPSASPFRRWGRLRRRCRWRRWRGRPTPWSAARWARRPRAGRPMADTSAPTYRCAGSRPGAGHPPPRSPSTCRAAHQRSPGGVGGAVVPGRRGGRGLPPGGRRWEMARPRPGPGQVPGRGRRRGCPARRPPARAGPLRSSERRVEAMPVDELERRVRARWPQPLALAVTALLAAGAGQVPAYQRSSAGEGLCQYWQASPEVRRVLYEVGDPRVSPACRSGGDPVEAIRSAFDAWGAASRSGDSAPCTDMRLSFQGRHDRHRHRRRRQEPHRHPARVLQRVPLGGPSGRAVPRGRDLRGRPRLLGPRPAPRPHHRHLPGLHRRHPRRGRGGERRRRTRQGFLVTCVDPPAPVCSEERRTGCIGMDLQNTMTHEAGHVLGFSHSELRASTMFAMASRGETSKRVALGRRRGRAVRHLSAGRRREDCGSRARAVGARDTWLGLSALALLLRRRSRQDTTTPA